MILTLTLNPAVDKLVLVPDLRLGQVHRVDNSEFDPAGKGINVSRVVNRLGWPTIAFGFLAGDVGSLVASALADEGVQSYFVRVPGQTRLNVSIFDRATGAVTTFIEAGPVIAKERLEALEAQFSPWLEVSRVLVLAGNVPRGIPADVYACYVRLASQAGALAIVDADGESLRRGIAARPYLVKPNRAEAERLLGRPLPDVSALAAAACEILARGVHTVVISCGAEGAICAQGSHVWQAVPPRVERRSTMGAGDAMVAGLAISVLRGQDIVEGLRLGTAAGAACAMTPGTALCPAAEVARLLPEVRVQQLS